MRQVEKPTRRSVSLVDEAATRRLGAAIAKQLRAGDLIALRGGLGAGKTALARAIIRARQESVGLAGEEVPSPTFTLVQVYAAAELTLWHFDLYRLERAEEVYELGIEDALAGGVTLIEWPERIEDLLPDDRLDVDIDFGEDAGGRMVALTLGGDWTARLGEIGA